MSGRRPNLTKKNPRALLPTTAKKVAGNIITTGVASILPKGIMIGKPSDTAVRAVMTGKPVEVSVKTKKIKTQQYDPTKRAPLIAGGGSEATSINLTTLAYSIFGKSYVQDLLNKKIIEDVRGIWELSSPTTQCNNVIGEVKYGETLCWICSTPIQAPVAGPPLGGLTPECEHVLPIAQAVVYTGLYSNAARKHLFPSEMMVLTDSKITELIKKEYRWAHRICNQVKNDDSYLDFNLAEQEYFVRTDKIADLLNRIKTNSRTYGTEIKPLLTASVIRTAITNAITVYQQICDELNKPKAPKLLELAGIISAGYGPRKVGVNPRWEHEASHMTPEEMEKKMEGQVRKEIIKANIEYDGIVKKTLILIGAKLTEISAPAADAFITIANLRRPEYISLLMRITPTQTNMKYAIRYIRNQLFSELATVDAKTLGLSDIGRRSANDRFQQLLKIIDAFTPLAPNEKFNGELVKANLLYQEDPTIGDTIRRILEEVIKDGSKNITAERIYDELVQETKETSGGDPSPEDVSSEYTEIIGAAQTLFSSMDPTSVVSSASSVISEGSDPWIDPSSAAMAALNSEETTWDRLSEDDRKTIIEINETAEILYSFRSKPLNTVSKMNNVSMNGTKSGGSRKRTRKIRRRRT